MSSFDGNDLFGSGGHHIEVGAHITAKKRSGFAGVGGLDSLNLGARGAPVRIIGVLKAANAAALQVLITNIEDAIDNGAATLIDNFAVTWTNVELDNYRPMGHRQQSATEVLQRYAIRGVQLY